MVDHDISGRSAGDHGARDKPPRRLAARRVEPEVEMKQRRGTTTRSTTMKHTLMLLIAPLALAGCQTIGPTWSELSGDRYYNTTTRSEEHTSELQSHHDLVCRLLLEKKKKK